MYWPFFSLGCNLEINEKRTAAYLSNACDICTPNSILRDLGRYTCSCDALDWEIFVDEDGVESVVVADYVAPDVDGAPWYTPNEPASARFLGFLIDDVTMESVVSRNVSTRATAFGGGILGPLRKKERTIKFSVRMFACDSEAMDYGFRYLTDALGGQGCDDDCTLCEAQYRENCALDADPPTVAQLQDGLWNLRNVGLISGPNYTSDTASSFACNVRTVEFTLASELPYKYKCPVIEVDNQAFEAVPVGCQPIDFWFCETTYISNSVSEEQNIGETALIVQVTAGSKALGGVVINITPDSFGFVCDPGSAPVGYTPPEPCASVHLTEVPSGATLTYDTSIESILMQLPGGGIIDGTPYIDTRFDTVPTFPTLRCGEFCVQVGVDHCSVTPGSVLTLKSVHREI